MRRPQEFRTGARALVESLAKAGAEIVFGYPGGNVLDIFECFRTAPFRFILGRHEQGSVHMADGYARVTGRPGVVVVTSGPGLTNTITGLGCANMDGIPLVLVCGQVPLADIGTDAFQEADTTGLTRSVSKHNFLVKSADEIPETVAAAFYIATHGKPGPVVIDVPRDVQLAPTASRYPERVCLRAYHPEVAVTPREVVDLARLVNAAHRPVILAGGGVIAAGAADDVRALSRKAGIPVATTLMGLGSVDSASPLSLGMAGVFGTAEANGALAAADLVLALGVRFNDRMTDAFRRRRGQRIVQVDCDPAVIDRNVRVDLGIVADIKDLLTVVDSRIRARPAAPAAPVRTIRAGRALTADGVVAAISEATGGHCLLVTDVGEHQMAAARGFPHSHPRHFLTSGGMGAMGFGIPAAIGAALARPDHRVVAVLGDGGAQMTAEELIVAAELKLKVTFVVLVNGTLGLVRRMKKGGAFATEIRSPDFVLLAKAHGLKAARVASAAALRPALAKALRAKGPVLVEVRISGD